MMLAQGDQFTIIPPYGSRFGVLEFVPAEAVQCIALVVGVPYTVFASHPFLPFSEHRDAQGGEE